MVTLANLQGGSLVADLDPLLDTIKTATKERRLDERLAEAFRREDEKEAAKLRREAASQAEDVKNIGLLLGGEPAPQEAPTAAPPSRQTVSLGILGQIDPQLAQAAGKLQGSPNPEETEDFRDVLRNGVTLAQEIQKLPTFEAKIKRLGAEAARMSAAGEDVSRLVELSNMTEQELDLELTRMEVKGAAAQEVVPETTPEAGLRFFDTPEKRAAFPAFASKHPIFARKMLDFHEKRLQREARARESQLAREDAAAARQPERLEDVFDDQGNLIAQRNLTTGELTAVPKTFAGGLEDNTAKVLGFSKDQAGRFNAAIARGQTRAEAIDFAVSTATERTNFEKVDAAKLALDKSLDRWVNFVEENGAQFLPGTVESQQGQSQRRAIQLQMKELFNLGVLNGPDLELMDSILADTQLGIFNLAPLNPFVSTSERGKVSVSEIKKTMTDIIEAKRAALGGRGLSPRQQTEDVQTTPGGTQFRIIE